MLKNAFFFAKINNYNEKALSRVKACHIMQIMLFYMSSLSRSIFFACSAGVVLV